MNFELLWARTLEKQSTPEITDATIKNFGELVVKYCAMTCEDIGNDSPTDESYNKGRRSCAREILQNFGVD
jgi:hypothetical protein